MSFLNANREIGIRQVLVGIQVKFSNTNTNNFQEKKKITNTNANIWFIKIFEYEYIFNYIRMIFEFIRIFLTFFCF